MTPTASKSPPISIGILGMMQLMLLVLKVCGAIELSWFWVWSPYWFPLATILCLTFGLLLFVVVILALVVIAFYSYWLVHDTCRFFSF